jgi:DNA polymerase I
LLIEDRKTFLSSLEDISNSKDVVVDTETSGLQPWLDDRMCGIGVCLDDWTTYYFPFRHKPDLGQHPLFTGLTDFVDGNLPMDWLPELLNVLSKPSCLIGHNIKFDLAVLHQDGFVLGDYQRLEETLVGARLYYTEEHPEMDLGHIAKTVLGPRFKDWKGDFAGKIPTYKPINEEGKKVNVKRYDMVSAVDTADYCESDCWVTRKARDFFHKHIVETKQERVWEQECELLRVLWDMERDGVYQDHGYVREVLPRMYAKVEEMCNTIHEIVGYKFDVLSLKQLTKAFDHIGLKSPHLTPKGNPKWALAEILGIDHPIGQMVINVRLLTKTITTFFEPALRNSNQTSHCSFKSWGTVTGRMSCHNPNMQNINKALQKLGDNEEDAETLAALKVMIGARQGSTVEMTTVTGRKVGGHTAAGVLSMASEYNDDGDTVAVRRMYVPRPGFHLYMFDYSQMEMRVFSDFVVDPELTKLLDDPASDFHDTVTTKVWGIEKDNKLWDFYRNLAKTVNFGLIFGLGVAKLAIQMQKTEEEAREFKKQYFDRFPAAYEFVSSVNRAIAGRGKLLNSFTTYTYKGKEYTRQDRGPGYIYNRFHRRYELSQERNYVGVNYLVQGTAADIVKNRMIAVSKFLKEERLRSRLLIQVHDELDMEIAVEEESYLAPKIVEIMQERQIKTLLPVEASKGFPSWAHKQKVCFTCFGAKRKKEEHICVGEVEYV